MNSIKHLAIIMDGNGRYAQKLGKLRIFGHKKGVEKVREIAIYCNQLGIEVLTLYAFSTENWKRPKDEVKFLMSLPKVFFNAYLKELMEKNIKITMIGEIDDIPKEAKEIFLKAIEKTKNNTGMILNFALNYGSRNEIIRACKKYANDFSENKNIVLDEKKFEEYLYTYDFPEVDLMIRTSGEMRLSNFLLWQLAYSELIFSKLHWPEFDKNELDNCIEIFKNRTRRYGGLND